MNIPDDSYILFVKIFAQEQHSDKGVKRVAEELGVEVHYINPLSYNWKEEVERITQILIE